MIASRPEEFDVVIVGSGAGGGIASYVLSKAGARVCVLEKGPWLHPSDYGDDELRFGDRNFIEEDPLIEPRTFRNEPEDGEHLYVGRVLGLSRCVGGGTVHYGAVSFRFRPEDFNALSYWGSLPGAEIVNWPISYDELLPYYNAAERLIGVSGGQPGARRTRAPRARRRVARRSLPDAGASAQLRGKAVRGRRHPPAPAPLRDPRGHQQPRSRRPPGLLVLRVLLKPRLPDRGQERHAGDRAAQGAGDRTPRDPPGLICLPVVLGRSGRAERVEYIDGAGRHQSIRGRVIVLSCSTVDTPRLVLLSELPPDLVNLDVVGRHLMVHHYPGGIGFFSERIDYYRGFWSMRCLGDFYLGPEAGVPAFGYGNLQTVGPSSGYPLGAGGMISTAKFCGWGANHKTLMSNVFGHVQWLDMNGQDPPVPSNMVDLDPTVRDVYGFPVSRITYRHHPNDYRVAADMIPRIAEILTEIGAESVESVFPLAATTSIPQPGQGGSGQRGPGRRPRIRLAAWSTIRWERCVWEPTRTRASSIPISGSTGSPTCT